MKCIKCQVRKRAKNRKICYSCKNKQYEEKHPIKAAFYRLKGHAKARGKSFTLTLEQFEQFATKVDYTAKKGRTKYSYHIDRIDETQGYHADNIQILTNTENVRKYVEWKSRDRDGNHFKVVTMKPNAYQDEDCPF